MIEGARTRGVARAEASYDPNAAREHKALATPMAMLDTLPSAARPVDVRQLYAHPQTLWLICPILMYWIGRILLLAHRRFVDEDPILFAVKDHVSVAAVAAIGLILNLAK